MTEPVFLKKIRNRQKNNQKWSKKAPKTVFFDFSGKSLVILSENDYESSYGPRKNYMPGKNLILKLLPRMLPANEISVFLNSQCFINGFTSDFYICNAGRHE